MFSLQITTFGDLLLRADNQRFVVAALDCVLGEVLVTNDEET
jgi:hypothetical protein